MARAASVLNKATPFLIVLTGIAAVAWLAALVYMLYFADRWLDALPLYQRAGLAFLFIGVVTFWVMLGNDHRLADSAADLKGRE